MGTTVTQGEAAQLRSVLETALEAVPGLSNSAREAFAQLLDVLEAGDEPVVLGAASTVSTGEAARLLGVSRMTVVRLVDRGELRADVTAAHRRIRVADLAHYQATSRRQRREALAELAAEIDGSTPADEFIPTR